jgi:hypothetical protein
MLSVCLVLPDDLVANAGKFFKLVLMRADAKTVPGFPYPPPSVLPTRDLCCFAPIIAFGRLIKGTDGAEAIWF